MREILIYMQRSMLKPIGGPLGYNYNLATQLEAKGVKNIHYMMTSQGDYTKLNKKISQLKIGWLRNFLVIIKSIIRKYKRLYGWHHKSIVNLDDYDIVHFHSTADMFECRDSLKDYKGKVVLTSHSPTVLWKEQFDMLTPWEKKHMSWFYKKLERMDEYAFTRADYIVFPCKEAEEPYYNNWDKYERLHNLKANQYRYLVTGINDCYAKQTREDIRSKYGIPEDSFVFVYVGRHNELKGYDLLKKIGGEVLKDENVWFLIAGVESPLKGINHPRWIEIGWTDDPYSIISASDLFVLPNRETYFDLIMLEILALGQLVLASYTGGNKYFDKFGCSGIFTYQDLNEAVDKAKFIMKLDNTERKRLQKLNREIYENNFTSSIFADNYVKMISSL